jgi:uncharacterized protein YraI
MKKLFLFITVLLLFTLSSFGHTNVATANVNFRSTPEFANNKIGIIPKGTVLTPISGIVPYGNWLPIEFKGKVGYVHRAYVKRKIAKQNKSLTPNH